MDCRKSLADIPRFVVVMSAGIVMSCSDDTWENTSPFVPTHVSVLAGRVLTTNGTPLDSVQININPNGPNAGFPAKKVITNALGEFTYDVDRMSVSAPLPQPDTMRVEIRADGLKKSYLTVGQSGPTARDTVVLTFVPYGQTPITTTVQIRLNVPNK